MNLIKVREHTFRPYLSEREISSRIQSLGSELRKRLEGEEVVFFVILKGSLFVAADVIRSFGMPCTVEAVRAQSYTGMKSKGIVDITMTSEVNLDGKSVVILEDIVETGRTLQAIHHHLRQSKAKQILTLSLLRKPSALANPINIDFVGFDIDQEFVIGYGLDFDEEARYLRDIYILDES